MAVAAYTLLATDGSSVEARDETRPMPGFESPDEPTTDTEESSDAVETVETVKPDEPATDGEGDAAPDTDKAVVWKYSTGLKVTIILTGVVLGGCLYAAIVVPDVVKRKKKDP